MKTRIYVVKVGSGPSEKTHLVDAASKSQAIRHVAEGMISAEVATTRDVAILVGSGTKVETALEAEE